MSTPRSVRSPESPGKRPRNWEPGAARPRASWGYGSSSGDRGGDRNQLGEVSLSWAAASVRGSPNSSCGDGQVQASFPKGPGKAGRLRTCGRARQDPGCQASVAPGKVLGGAWGGALGGSSPGTASPGPGRRQKASKLK